MGTNCSDFVNHVSAEVEGILTGESCTIFCILRRVVKNGWLFYECGLHIIVWCQLYRS